MDFVATLKGKVKMNNIEFYIPKNESIPTSLRLKVDDVAVTYRRVENGFEFIIDVESDEKALEIANEIIDVMKLEHDESQHGVSWRTVSLTLIPTMWDFQRVVLWKYRVRDSY